MFRGVRIRLELIKKKGAVSVAPAGAGRSGNLFPRVPSGHPGLHSSRPYWDSWTSVRTFAQRRHVGYPTVLRATP